MNAYLIESGNFFIIFVKELNQYFFIDDNDHFEQFVSKAPKFEEWQKGKPFQYVLNQTSFTDHSEHKNLKLTMGVSVAEDEVLQKFYDPKFNPAGVIAMRNSEEENVLVLHKRRFLKLIQEKTKSKS